MRSLQEELRKKRTIIGSVAANGLVASCMEEGGADFLLVFSAGAYRMSGRSSYAAHLPFASSNNLTWELGTKQILTVINQIPVFFGLFASDPFINLKDYIQRIKNAGFSGIANYPTLSVVDGQFREALEENGDSYELEVEAMRIAKAQDLMTVAFVVNPGQAEAMAKVGVDIVCVHLGLTIGGLTGATKSYTLLEVKHLCDKIFARVEKYSPYSIKTIYSGPINSIIDTQFVLSHTDCQGYIGGSVFDRIPIENSTILKMKSFKEMNNSPNLNSSSMNHKSEYVNYVKEYIDANYQQMIQLSGVAQSMYISTSYLSRIFKEETGYTFTEYLIQYRMDKAKKLLEETRLSCLDVAFSVGYYDYAQFSKIFKAKTSLSPSIYRNRIRGGKK